MSDISGATSVQVDQLRSSPEPGHGMGPVADDWEAAEAWLRSVRRKSRTGSSATVDTYRHHLNKLRWFCENIVLVTPSRWSMREVDAYVGFLAVLPDAALPDDSGQRTPFRSQPTESSQSDILRVAHAMFAAWKEMGYIRINPMGLEGAPRRRTANPQRAVPLDLYDLVLDVMRANRKPSFTGRQAYLRDRFVFEALRGLGLRANEMVKSTMGAFRLEAAPGTGERYWIFVVDKKVAKGGIERMLPVPVGVWDALSAYRAAFGLSEVPAEGERIPLVLSAHTVAVVIGSRKVRHASDRRFFDAWGAVGTRQGLYRIVKDRLAATSKALAAEGRGHDAAKLQAASPHWLRSTFARASLMTGNGLREVADMLGHGSIDTTMIYTAPGVLAIIAALEQLRPGAIARESVLK